MEEPHQKVNRVSLLVPVGSQSLNANFSHAKSMTLSMESMGQQTRRTLGQAQVSIGKFDGQKHLAFTHPLSHIWPHQPIPRVGTVPMQRKLLKRQQMQYVFHSLPLMDSDSLNNFVKGCQKAAYCLYQLTTCRRPFNCQGERSICTCQGFIWCGINRRQPHDWPRCVQTQIYTLYVGLTQVELVLTMYEKGGGKFGRHSWTKECRNIGLLSYMVVQVWRQSVGQRCQFKTVHGPSSHLALPRFAHIPSTSFLSAIPIGFASRNEHGIEINSIFMDSVFGKLITSKPMIIRSVLNLQTKIASKNDEDV